MSEDAGFDATLTRDEITVTRRDAALLRAVAAEGSLNAAADSLERSYSRAQRRVVALEDAFGPLVERQRGGSGGGGSDLTEAGRDLLARFDRLRAALAGVADAEETVFAGRVVDRDGELATVETAAGPVRALLALRGGDDGNDGEEPGSEETGTIEVAVRADAVTLHAPADAPEGGHTSARNRFRGTVASVERGASIALVSVDLGGVELAALVTRDSVETLDLDAGRDVVASFKATATRGVERD